MGLRIDSYSLNELHRIAVPGSKAAPCLFWVLPIGNWKHYELDRYWQHFTEKNSFCRTYGLLLVNQYINARNSDSSINLKSLGAVLDDVMPEGYEQYFHSSVSGKSQRSLLVLSGGYPQPGWGLLIEGIRNEDHFEQLVLEVKTQLSIGADITDDLKAISDATAQFHKIRNIEENRPERPNTDQLNRDIQALEVIGNPLRDAYSALKNEDVTAALKKLQELRTQLKLSPSQYLPVSMASELSLNLTCLDSAQCLLAITDNEFTEYIEPLIDSVASSPKDRRGAAFHELVQKHLKDALKACIFLFDSNIVQGKSNLLLWARQTVDKVPGLLIAAISAPLDNITKDLLPLKQAIASIDTDYMQAMRRYQTAKEKLRVSFRLSTTKAVQTQWDLGPHFLVKLEQVCRKQGLAAASIPWDPARMIGWKISSHNIKIHVLDLQYEASRYMPQESPTVVNHTGKANPDEPVDGSYFTDYVHHIAMSTPGSTPWEVTRDLVARYLKPSDIHRIIDSYGEIIPQHHDTMQLSSQLIGLLGWRQFGLSREPSLASCIDRQDKNENPVLKTGLSGNDLRKVLESFCKDIIDTVVSHLGSSQSGIWDVIQTKVPEFRPATNRNDWSEEVSQLTLGSAALLLPALGKLSFPEKSSAIDDLVNNLRKVSNLLNFESHHQEMSHDDQSGQNQISELIYQLLEAATSVMGECPWHLHVTHTYGSLPKVLSGEGWSHSSRTPRQLKVIVWTGADKDIKNNQQILFWNSSGKNPVIPDPVIIKRPSI